MNLTQSLRACRTGWRAGCGSLLLVAGLTAQAQNSVTNGLVAYWNFDAKNFKDSAGNFDGTPNGSNPISFVSGPAGFGQAIQLDGNDQYVEITGNSDPDALAFQGGSVTIAGWFKVEGFDKSWQALVAKGENSSWRVARRGTGTDLAYAGGIGEGPDDGPDVTDGNWHHFAAITDGAAVNFGTAIYIDGVQHSANAGTPNLAANGKNVFIGENPDARGRYWNGEIDDLGIWNRVLTEAEIAALVNKGAGKPLSSFFAPPLDTDKDGIPDDWEIQYGMNPNDPKDATLDYNKNGRDNLHEYLLGLDPWDTTGPNLVTVAGATVPATTLQRLDGVSLTFDKDLDPSTATNIANYKISPSVAVTGATYKSKVVTLTTAAQTAGATKYTVTVSGVTDLSLNKIVANSGVFFTPSSATTGVAKFSYWGNITGGTSVDLLTGDPRFPATPDLVIGVLGLDSRYAFPDDSHENYGATIEGLLTPTDSGNYTFFLRSDDASEFWLSTDGTAGKLVKIAEQTGCCNAFTEPDGSGGPAYTSTPIALKAGTSYFFQLLYKEGGGGDYGQVAWRKDGDTTPAASLTPIPGKYLSVTTPVPVPAAGVYTTQTPAPKAKGVSPGTAVSIVHVDGNKPWATNNVSLVVDGDPVKATLTKVGSTMTIAYKLPGLLPSKTTHTIGVTHPDPAGAATTDTWSFTTAAYQGAVTDIVNGHQGLLAGNASLTPDAGGHTGKAGDLAVDLTTKNGSWVDVYDATFMNVATAKDELSVSFWLKRYDVSNGSAFWANSASAGRGFQAHTPWGDNTIYFDTMGCCDGSNQRISASITTFPAYVDDSFWTNNWHHFVFSKKGADKNIYIDGTLFLNGQSALPLLPDFTELAIGTDGTPGGDFTHGKIDDFAVFATALSPASVTALSKGSSPQSLTTEKLLAFWDFNEALPSTTSVTNGLVAYWNFDGNLQDSVKNFDGTAHGTNAIPFVAGKDGFGKAIRLNGIDQFVEITGGNNAELEFPKGSMSVAGWFKVEAFDKQWQALLSKGEGSNYRIARRGGENTIAYAGGLGEGADDTPIVNDGQWHHFVAVTDANTNAFGTALYIDGVLHSINAAKPVLTSSKNNLLIGENPDAKGRQWNGSIDDVAIWNRVLTAGEVGTLYNNGSGTALSTYGIQRSTGGGSTPTVSISVDGTGKAVLTYTGTLQSATSIKGPFSNVAGATSPYSVAPGSTLFYRAQQ